MEAKTSVSSVPLCFKGFVLLPCRRVRLEDAERVALYPCQQTPGTANFGKAICPPALTIFAAVASKFTTSIEQTKALVPCEGGGVFAGRFSKPPRGPSVSIRQYSTGNPSALVKAQPKIAR